MQYEFTITIHPRHYGKSAIDQYKMIEKMVLEELAIYEISAVAELTQIENIHVHCVIKLTPKEKTVLCNWLRKDRIKKVIGRCSLSVLVDYPKWISYLKKDLEKTQKIINKDPVLIDNQQVLYRGFKVGPQGELYFDSEATDGAGGRTQTI